jgi:hypothetical protein
MFAIFDTKSTAERFIELMNTASKSIHITAKISHTRATFLDIEVYKGNRFVATGKLDVQLHQKTVNKFLFLPPMSFHNPKVF